MPKAEMAAKGEGEFAVGDWCRFCKAKNTCRARAEEYLRLAQMEFKPPELLSEEEIAEVLKVADELAKWSADVYAYAQDEAITHGRVWNGFKLVEGRSNRKYVNEEEVADAAKAAGYEDIYKKSLIGITEMEKLMGKKDYWVVWCISRRAKSPWCRNPIRDHQFKQKPLRRILRRMNK